MRLLHHEDNVMASASNAAVARWCNAYHHTAGGHFSTRRGGVIALSPISIASSPHP